MTVIFILLFTCQIVFLYIYILVIFFALFDLGCPLVSWKSADLQDWAQSRTRV